MRIALYNVTTAVSLRGIESCVWELARAFRANSHEPEIVTGKGNINPYGEKSIRAFAFLPRQYYAFLPIGPRKLLERLIFFVSACPYLIKTRYDIFVIFKPFDFPAAIFLKLFHHRMKVIFFSGGTDFIFVDKWLGGFMDAICAPSRHNAEILKKRYHCPIHVAYYGVDTERFAPSEEKRARFRERLSVEKETTLLLSVGQLIGWKGHEIVVRSLPSLPNVRYAIIGIGDEEPALRELAASLGVSERFSLLGKIENGEISGYMNAADLFVHPSYEEPLGLVVLEALACGTPVVASDSGGVPEMIHDGVNGYLAKTGDPSDFAEKIRTALVKRTMLRENTRKRVLEDFTWKATAETLLSSVSNTKTQG
jgi:glycosyltransferase involved in cell wall biosynthesis